MEKQELALEILKELLATNPVFKEVDVDEKAKEITQAYNTIISTIAEK